MQEELDQDFTTLQFGSKNREFQQKADQLLKAYKDSSEQEKEELDIKDDDDAFSDDDKEESKNEKSKEMYSIEELLNMADETKLLHVICAKN